jgi:hypothetical protein
VTRFPVRLLVIDTESGTTIQTTLSAVGDCDDVFFDQARKRIYASGGEGAISIFDQKDPDHCAEVSRIPTVNGAPQKPIEGVSMVYTFDDAKAASKRTTQYFEMLGIAQRMTTAGIASTTPKRVPWQPKAVPGAYDPMSFNWELYHVAADFSQADDLAKQNPDKLRELQDLFWAQAALYNVLPLDATFAERADPAIRPSLTRGRTTFTYYPGMIRIPEGSTPDLKNKSFTITADVEIP